MIRSCSLVLLALPLVAGSAWKSLAIQPGKIVLARPGATQRFVVVGVAPDGSFSDLTAAARVTSDARILTVDRETGLITARVPGKASIKATIGGVAAITTVEVRNQNADVTVRFNPDIVSILTTKGCNGSGCHGSPAGQSGFKLSLFGYDTAADYEMIVKASDGRRVSLQSPDESLLLEKPSFRSPHGGGRVLPADSEEYRTIRSWLAQGARLQSDGVRLTSLELYPAERILVGAGSRQRLAVIGRLSDGSTRDMTREVRYSLKDDSVASISSDGVVTAAANGLTAVIARAMGQVAAGQFGVVSTKSTAQVSPAESTTFVDRLVFTKMRQMGIEPYPLSSDGEFVRRVYLDAIGTLPRPEDVRAFLADTDADKRDQLVDQLLDRDEYAAFWTVKFEDWFRNCQLNSQGRSMGSFKDWIREWVAADRPYDQVIREILTSQGDTSLNPATNFWHPATDFMLKKFDVNKITPAVSRLFLGVRIECAECHNHPLENYTQDDFYGLAAFFAQLNVKHGVGEYRRTWFLEDDREVYHPVTKQPVAPKFLGGDRPAPAPDRRTALADWIVSPANPAFARATVNRVWHEYFDEGIVEPFDDFRSTNPPTNRALLDQLARYFVDGGYRLKPLHRLILKSRAYQLSSVDSASDRKLGPLDRQLFTRYSPRKLPAEVLLDAVSQITGTSHQFANYPKGTRALDVYAPDSPDYFLTTFGFPRRDVLADRSKAPTLSQALHLINGDAITRKVGSPDNVLGHWLPAGGSDAEILNNLYERAYARQPMPPEKERILRYLEREQESGKNRRRAWEGVLWSVLNSKEFQTNH